MSVFKKAARFLTGRGKSDGPSGADAEDVTVPCCTEEVHIAYRGVSDERLYLARSRKWGEVRYYKPNGLRVFCAVCRQRIY